MMRSLLFAIAGLLLGVAVHVATVLLVPAFATDDAWARVGLLGPDGAFHSLPAPRPGEPSADSDPLVKEAVCRFDLAAGPLRVTAAFPDTFWSVAIFDRAGRNIYSFNDNAADQSRLDLVIVTPAQGLALGNSPPASLQNAIVATLVIDAGIAVLRAFVPDDASIPGVTAALAAARCAALG